MRTRYVAVVVVALATAVAATYATRRESRPQVADAQAETGWRGGIRLGVSLAVPGQPLSTRYEVPREPGPLSLRTQAMLGNSSCGAASSDLTCPRKEDARVSFRVSALLDGRTPLPLTPGDLVLTGASPNAELTTQVRPGPLAPGVHCVLVTVLENARPVVAAQLPYHSNAAVYELRVAGSATDHCAPAAREVDTLPGIGPVACGRPTISVSRGAIEIRRASAQRERVAVALICGTRTVVAWARDGHLLGAGEHPAPWRHDGSSRWTQSDVALEPAAWVMVVVHRMDGAYSAGASDAVVVG